MSSEKADRRHGPVALAVLVGLILLGFALRFYRLGAWGFEATEMFTLRDSIQLRPNNPRPLVYLLNYYLIQPLTPLNEFGFRLLPALFGVLAIPLFYLVSRRLVGTRAALFGAALLTVSSFHVYYSQYARYWTLVFLLSAIYPYAIYIGLRERNRAALALGLVTGLLGVMAHPVAVLLVGGLFLWLLASYVQRDKLSRLWQRKAVRWATLIVVLIGVVIAVRYVPVLRNWISERDTGKGGQFMLHIPNAPGVKQLILLVGFVDMVTIPVVLGGLVGIYLLRQRNRPSGPTVELPLDLPGRIHLSGLVPHRGLDRVHDSGGSGLLHRGRGLSRPAGRHRMEPASPLAARCHRDGHHDRA